MKYIFIIIFIGLVILFFKNNMTNEGFVSQSNIYYLLGKQDNVKALFKDVTKYTKPSELKGSKAILLDGKKSAIYLNDINLNLYTLRFFFKALDVDKKSILSSVFNETWSLIMTNKRVRLLHKGQEILSSKIIEKNKWYFLAIAISNDKAKIHINGTENESIISDNEDVKHIILGTNKYNKDSFYGFIGKISLDKKYNTKDELCDYSSFCPVIIPHVPEVKPDPVPVLETKPKLEMDLEDDYKVKKMCKFIPHGSTLKQCYDKCRDTPDCDIKYCQDVCNGCKDYNVCEWVVKPIPPVVKSPEPILRRPYSMKIKAIPFDSKITIQWKREAWMDGGSPITDYIVMVYETFNKADGTRISVTGEGLANEINCSYDITGLKNQVYYDVCIRAVNNVGLGDISNIETTNPVGPVKIESISNALLESDVEIAKKVSEDLALNGPTSTCGSLITKQNDGHILNQSHIPFTGILKSTYNQ